MRKLLCDAAEALWMLFTAPLRKLIADAVADAGGPCPNVDTPAAADGPALRWGPREDPAQYGLGVPPAWLSERGLPGRR